jgi:hypothetical protein
MRITEEILERKRSYCGTDNRLTAVLFRCVEHATVGVNFAGCGGRSVSIVLLPTKAT